MSTTRSLRRPLWLCAIACTLLLTTTCGAAVAAPDPSYQPLDAREQYYASYADPEPLTPSPSDGTPWLPVALSITGGLAVVAVGASQLRRVRVRRRRAAHTPA